MIYYGKIIEQVIYMYISNEIKHFIENIKLGQSGILNQ